MQARATEFDLQLAGPEAALQVVELAAGSAPARRSDVAPATLLVAVDRDGRMPEIEVSEYDLLFTTARTAGRPWITVAASLDAELAVLDAAVRRHGIAAAVLAQVLHAGESLALDDALAVESFAFSMLLGGERFARWLRAGPRSSAPATPGAASRASADATVAQAQAATTARVRCTRERDVLTVHLANPARRNAFDAAMRDALVEALAAACDDPTLVALELRADGPDFSAGGDLDEFGSAVDPALAHAVRTLRSPARLLGRLAARTTAYLHGACVGAGIEIPAAAGRVVAAPDSRLWLPELAMGLVPGAGGTATIARRIGRQRLLHWALHGTRIDATTALSWGLVDEVGTAASTPGQVAP